MLDRPPACRAACPGGDAASAPPGPRPRLPAAPPPSAWCCCEPCEEDGEALGPRRWCRKASAAATSRPISSTSSKLQGCSAGPLSGARPRRAAENTLLAEEMTASADASSLAATVRALPGGRPASPGRAAPLACGAANGELKTSRRGWPAACCCCCCCEGGPGEAEGAAALTAAASSAGSASPSPPLASCGTELRRPLVRANLDSGAGAELRRAAAAAAESESEWEAPSWLPGSAAAAWASDDADATAESGRVSAPEADEERPLAWRG